MTLSSQRVIVPTRASRPPRSLLSHGDAGGLDVGERGCEPSRSVGSVAKRRTSWGRFPARRAVIGALSCVCGFVLVGCAPKHTAADERVCGESQALLQMIQDSDAQAGAAVLDQMRVDAPNASDATVRVDATALAAESSTQVLADSLIALANRCNAIGLKVTVPK